MPKVQQDYLDARKNEIIQETGESVFVAKDGWHLEFTDNILTRTTSTVENAVLLADGLAPAANWIHQGNTIGGRAGLW